MQVENQSRPLECLNPQDEILNQALLSREKEAASREAQLQRLGIIPGGTPTPKNSDGIPISVLRSHVKDYLDDLVLNNKPKTIEAKSKAYDKLFWYLEENGHESCGEREIRAMLSYVKNAHLLPGGRWGRGIASDSEASRFVRPATERTIEYYFVYIRALFRWLLDCEVIQKDPTAKIKLDTPPVPLIEPFSLDQVSALYKATSKSVFPKRDAALIVLMFDTGLRAAEVCNIALPDLTFKPASGIVKVIGKGDKPRNVPFGKRSLKHLRVYLQAMPPRAGMKIWTSRCGRYAGDPLQPNGLLQLYGRLGKMANIRGVRCSPHTMRHTFAINFLRNGGNITVLQALLGHEKIEVTMRYLKIVEEDVIGQHQRYSPSDGLEF